MTKRKTPTYQLTKSQSEALDDIAAATIQIKDWAEYIAKEHGIEYAMLIMRVVGDGLSRKAN